MGFRSHFKLFRIVASLLGVASSFIPVGAHACGGATPRPPPTVDGIIPSSGSSGVARDAGIVIFGASSAFADVKLLDEESLEEVPLLPLVWLPPAEGEEDAYALYPEVPLAPLRGYRIEATAPAPADEPPNETVTSSFVTSEAVLDPLVLSGQLVLSLRAGEVDVVECSPCGDDCRVTGTRPALLADVTLPVVSGGQGLYRAVLHFSDQTPLRANARSPVSADDQDAAGHEIHLAKAFVPGSGSALTVQQEIIEEDFPYAACFTYVVWDPAHHVAQTSACLPSLSPEEQRTLAGKDPAQEPAASDEPSADVLDVGQTESSCTLGMTQPATESTPLGLWSALLVSVGVIRRASRRR